MMKIFLINISFYLIGKNIKVKILYVNEELELIFNIYFEFVIIVIGFRIFL